MMTNARMGHVRASGAAFLPERRGGCAFLQDKRSKSFAQRFPRFYPPFILSRPPSSSLCSTLAMESGLDLTTETVQTSQGGVNEVKDEIPQIPQIPQLKHVTVRFIGTGISFGTGASSSSSSSSFTHARAMAIVAAEFMEEKEDEPVGLMWLDGLRHPKIGTLGLPRSTVHPQPPLTGKRLRAWMQQEPWNKEYTCARDFWQWFESSNILAPVQGVCDMRDLELFGGDYGVLGDTGPLPRKYTSEGGAAPNSSSSRSVVGGKKWIAELHDTAAGTTLPASTEDNDSSLYQVCL